MKRKKFHPQIGVVVEGDDEDTIAGNGPSGLEGRSGLVGIHPQIPEELFEPDEEEDETPSETAQEPPGALPAEQRPLTLRRVGAALLRALARRLDR